MVLGGRECAITIANRLKRHLSTNLRLDYVIVSMSIMAGIFCWEWIKNRGGGVLCPVSFLKEGEEYLPSGVNIDTPPLLKEPLIRRVTRHYQRTTVAMAGPQDKFHHKSFVRFVISCWVSIHMLSIQRQAHVRFKAGQTL